MWFPQEITEIESDVKRVQMELQKGSQPHEISRLIQPLACCLQSSDKDKVPYEEQTTNYPQTGIDNARSDPGHDQQIE